MNRYKAYALDDVEAFKRLEDKTSCIFHATMRGSVQIFKYLIESGDADRLIAAYDDNDDFYFADAIGSDERIAHIMLDKIIELNLVHGIKLNGAKQMRSGIFRRVVDHVDVNERAFVYQGYLKFGLTTHFTRSLMRLQNRTEVVDCNVILEREIAQKIMINSGIDWTLPIFDDEDYDVEIVTKIPAQWHINDCSMRVAKYALERNESLVLALRASGLVDDLIFNAIMPFVFIGDENVLKMAVFDTEAYEEKVRELFEYELELIDEFESSREDSGMDSMDSF